MKEGGDVSQLGCDWRGSTGTLWNAHESPDLLSSTRPVSATPPDSHSKDTPKTKRRGGLRKKFRSLTEGLASFISGDKKEKGSECSCEQGGAPKKLRKSIFYVNRFDSNEAAQQRRVPAKVAPQLYKDDYSTGLAESDLLLFDVDLKTDEFNPWNFPRLTRSMSQGSGRNPTGGLRPVKAPPSPLPRRYTLWGVGPTGDNGSDIYALYKDRNECQVQPCGQHPVSYICPPTFGSYIENDPSTVMTPPRTPLMFGSPSSWSSQYPATRHKPYWFEPPSSTSYYGKYCAAAQDPSRSPLRFDDRTIDSRSLEFDDQRTEPNEADDIDRSPKHRQALRKSSNGFGKATQCNPYSISYRYGNDSFRNEPTFTVGSPALSDRISRSPSHLRGGVSKSPSHSERGAKSPCEDSKSLLFGLGAYRGDWYRRKAAKARLHTLQTGIGPEGAVVRRTTVGVVKEAGSLGITVRGGVHPSQPDKTRPLLITHVRTAGPVDREGTIKAGDRLVAVGGRSVERSSMHEAQEMLRSAPDALTLTIEYDVSVLTWVRSKGAALLVEVERPAATDLGLTLDRGGEEDTIVVRAVKAASIAERCGALAAGDVITRIDGTPVGQLTPAEATQLLRSSRHPVVTLEIIPAPPAASPRGPSHPHIMGSSYTGTLRPQHSSLPSPPSLTPPGSAPQHSLTHHSPLSCSNLPSSYPNTSGSHCPTYTTPYFSNFCTPCYATTAPSSCAHHAAVCPPSNCSDLAPFHNHNGASSANPGTFGPTSVARCAGRDAGCANLLDPHANDLYVRLDCLPRDGPVVDDSKVCRPCPASRCLTDAKTRACGCTGSTCGCTGITCVNRNKFSVTLQESDKEGYGLVLRPPVRTTDPDLAVPLVAAIDPHSPADRCGVLCVGDRITSVNGLGTAGLGAAEVIQLITTSQQSVALAVEFDTDKCYRGVAATETFAVTIPVKNGQLGIGVTLSETALTRCAASGDPADDRLGLLVTSVVQGSPAHRTTLVSPGDLVVAVDDHHVTDTTTAQDLGRRIAQKSGDAVTLLLLKADDCEECVQYTVEVSRRGGPLGITLTGSELPSSALYVASLTPGGLAERTGAIHAGDRLLAINGHSLRGQPLSKAVHLLQAAAQVVTLRIARPRRTGGQGGASEDGLAAPLSLDAAGGSWGGGEDLTEHPATSPACTTTDAHPDSPRTQKDSEEKGSPTESNGAEPCSSLTEGERRTAGNAGALCGKETSGDLAHPEPTGVVISDYGSKGVPASDPESKGSSASDSGPRDAFSPDPGPTSASTPDSGPMGVSASDPVPENVAASDPKQRPTEARSNEGKKDLKLTPEAVNGDAVAEQCQRNTDGTCNPMEGPGDTFDAVKNSEDPEEDIGRVNGSRTSTTKREVKASGIRTGNVQSCGNPRESQRANFDEGNLKLQPEKNCSVSGSSGNSTADFDALNENENGKRLPPDWDEMIAALNAISASCSVSVRHPQLQPLHHGVAHAPGHKAGQPGCPAAAGTGQTKSPAAAGPGQAEGPAAAGRTEAGVYSVSAAERSCNVGLASDRCEGSTHHVFRVSLNKDGVYEDFGFSVSDGLYEKGVYVNRIRKGGPADRSGRVKPYDRILQVNDTLSHDFDCCLTVPLIASAGDQLHLLLSRNLNEEMTPLLRRTPDFTGNPFTECHSQPKQQYFSQESSDMPVYAPLSASAKLQADRSQFLNAQLYCNTSPYLRKAEIHTLSAPRVAEGSCLYGHKGSPKSTNLSKKPPSPTVNCSAERNQREFTSSSVHHKIPSTSSSISELEDQLKTVSNLNRPHLQQWADETLTLPAHFRSSSGQMQQTRLGSKAPLTPQLGRQCLGNDSGCRANGSPVGDKVQALYGRVPDSNAPVLVATNSTNASCTAVASGFQNGRSSFVFGGGGNSLSPVSVSCANALRGGFSSSLSASETPHLHNTSTEPPSSIYVSKATVQFQVPASPKEKSRRSAANSNKALHNSDNSGPLLKTS